MGPTGSLPAWAAGIARNRYPLPQGHRQLVRPCCAAQLDPPPLRESWSPHPPGQWLTAGSHLGRPFGCKHRTSGRAQQLRRQVDRGGARCGWRYWPRKWLPIRDTLSDRAVEAREPRAPHRAILYPRDASRDKACLVSSLTAQPNQHLQLTRTRCLRQPPRLTFCS